MQTVAQVALAMMFPLEYRKADSCDAFFVKKIPEILLETAKTNVIWKIGPNNATKTGILRKTTPKLNPFD